MRLRLLDLFCGAGGAAMGYLRRLGEWLACYGEHSPGPERHWQSSGAMGPSRSGPGLLDATRSSGSYPTGPRRELALVRDLMAIDWMTWTEANQAIPPAYTESHRPGNIAEGRQPSEHGLSGYTNCRCRCEVCREARNAYQRAYRAAQAGAS